jgi:hypothetical protein
MYRCEPRVGLRPQTFSGQLDVQCSAKSSGQQHGGHTEPERRGEGEDESDEKAERGGRGVWQRCVKGGGASVAALIQSHAHDDDLG